MWAIVNEKPRISINMKRCKKARKKQLYKLKIRTTLHKSNIYLKKKKKRRNNKGKEKESLWGLVAFKLKTNQQHGIAVKNVLMKIDQKTRQPHFLFLILSLPLNFPLDSKNNTISILNPVHPNVVAHCRILILQQERKESHSQLKDAVRSIPVISQMAF